MITRDDRARLSRYLVTSVWNTAFGYGVFVLLIATLSARVHYLILAALTNIAAITNAYIVHKLFVFRTKGDHVREYLRYFSVYGAAAIGGLAVLAALKSGLGVNVYVAQAAVTVLQVAATFTGHSTFSFGQSQRS